MKHNIDVLLTGASGQLGNAIQVVMKNNSAIKLHCYTRNDLDITDKAQLSTCITQVKPDIVINCAAYTAVDKAEHDRENALAINAQGPYHLASLANAHDFMLIHLSTDYVFSGTNYQPNLENDLTQPINYYGETKCLGEEAIRRCCERYIILRVSGIFSEFGHNFLKTILRLATTKHELTIVNDQITCPTYAGDIAIAIETIIMSAQKKFGVYHYANQTPVSWYDFATAIVTTARIETDILAHQNNCVMLTPITSANFPTPAKRPPYAVLNCDKILRDYAITQQHWQNGILKSLQRLLPIVQNKPIKKEKQS